MFRSNTYRLASTISATVILLSVVFQHRTEAFARLSNSRLPGFSASPPRMAEPKATGGFRDEPSDNDNDDTDFYRDLQNAKKEKLGAFIPPEQARETAVQAEADFLRAMKETTDDFRKKKAELGSEGAIDAYLDILRDEDERNN